MTWKRRNLRQIEGIDLPETSLENPNKIMKNLS
jgi:hypothetical protein